MTRSLHHYVPFHLAQLFICGNSGCLFPKCWNWQICHTNQAFKLPLHTFSGKLQLFPWWNQRALDFFSIEPNSILQLSSQKLLVSGKRAVKRALIRSTVDFNFLWTQDYFIIQCSIHGSNQINQLQAHHFRTMCISYWEQRNYCHLGANVLESMDGYLRINERSGYHVIVQLNTIRCAVTNDDIISCQETMMTSFPIILMYSEMNLHRFSENWWSL